MASRLVQQRSSVEHAIGWYGELAIGVSPLSAPRVVPTDPDDDHVIACALTARADLIVSGYRDLLTLGGQFYDIPIVTARAALARIA